jgi:hypothetical protein
MRVNIVHVFVLISENRIMKPIEIILRRKERGWGLRMVGVDLIRYIAIIYVNVTMKSPCKLIQANKNDKKCKIIK